MELRWHLQRSVMLDLFRSQSDLNKGQLQYLLYNYNRIGGLEFLNAILHNIFCKPYPINVQVITGVVMIQKQSKSVLVVSCSPLRYGPIDLHFTSANKCLDISLPDIFFAGCPFFSSCA
jgi:hypothetical protein